MNRLKRSLLWAALMAIALLASLCIYGAFIGSERARAFFSSLPAAVYWVILIVLLAVGPAVFVRLRKVPPLLAMHLGCVAVLVGGIWGSTSAHAFRHQFPGSEKIKQGQMPILEGTEENQVAVPDSNALEELPFSVRLHDVRVEYYPAGTLVIQGPDKRMWRMAAEPGETLELGGDLGKVTITKVFENFRMDLAGDEPVTFDAPGGENPALEVLVDRPDGRASRRYVFAFRSVHAAQQELALAYVKAVSEYTSEVDIVRDGQVVARKSIEVNHPLHYRGYHFYQQSYGTNQYGEYTILGVVSDSGLYAVYIGYALLVAGVFWHFWVRRIPAIVSCPSVATAGEEQGGTTR